MTLITSFQRSGSADLLEERKIETDKVVFIKEAKTFLAVTSSLCVEARRRP
jgi:hypothetical protein